MRKLAGIFWLFIIAGQICFATTDTIRTSGFSFAPDTVTIKLGDTIRFTLASIHNAAEVSQSTWNANGNTSNGGFVTQFGADTVIVLQTLGTHYFVCQAHAFMGMKGEITVVTPPPTTTITIRSLADQDGNFSTTGDQQFKNWSLKLYQDSIGSGIVLGSASSADSLVVGGLNAGTYVAVEADSQNWSHISLGVDGLSQGATASNAWQISVGSGEAHRIDFVNYAPYTIINSGTTFVPESLVVPFGTRVHFALESIHDAVEVSQATWDADGNTPNGGFSVPFGGGDVTGLSAGVHYYVCTVHAAMGMKGTITVLAAPPPSAVTIRCIADQDGNSTTTADEQFKLWSLKLYQDSVGSGIVLDSVVSADSMVVTGLNPGTYVAVEADSQHWAHISVKVDGNSQGATAVHSWQFTVGSTENHAIDFLNYAPYTIINSGTAFLPDSLVVLAGTRIHFVLEQIHDVVEVSQATWDANGNISNGGFQLPFGGGDVVLFDTGVHYYVCGIHASMGMKGRIFVLSDSTVVSVPTNVLAGWDMISLPVNVPDNHATMIYPTAISKPFAYQGGYVPLTTMLNGYGYWMKFGDSETVSISGIEVFQDSVNVEKGWNIIGSISTPMPALGLTSQPPGIITSALFGYNGSYYTADTIAPGFGYWIEVNQNGVLNFNAPTGRISPSTVENNTSLADATSLSIRDAAGTQKSLYLIDIANETPRLHLLRKLPPPPPSGAFDVRFASGDQLKTVSPKSRNEYPIVISSAVYPLMLSWRTGALRDQVSLTLDGKELVLNGSGSLTLVHPIESISLKTNAGEQSPSDYRLDPAFPNPFNPSTIIRYGLPVQSRVTLKVYNLLGQVVATLVNETQSSGEKSVTWNAAGVSSGMYFIRFAATSLIAGEKSFSRVMKVVLQK